MGKQQHNFSIRGISICAAEPPSSLERFDASHYSAASSAPWHHLAPIQEMAEESPDVFSEGVTGKSPVGDLRRS